MKEARGRARWSALPGPLGAVSLQGRIARVLLRRMALFDTEGEQSLTVEELPALRDKVHRIAGLFRSHPRVRIDPMRAAGVPLERHTAVGASKGRAILYLHGGAWILGSPRTHRSYVSKLAYRTKVPIWVPDYRLAPEHPFPAGLEDCLAVYEHLLDSGIPPGGIVLAGDSAGGNLSLAMLVALRDRGLPLPAGAVGLSPATDLTGGSASHETQAAIDPWFAGHGGDVIAEWYAGREDPSHPWISPLFADLRGLPPVLLHVGDHEILRDDSTRFGERARANDVDAQVVVWPEMFHVFHLFTPLLPESVEANREVVGFVNARLC